MPIDFYLDIFCPFFCRKIGVRHCRIKNFPKWRLNFTKMGHQSFSNPLWCELCVCIIFTKFFFCWKKLILLSHIFSPKSPTNACLQYQTGLTGRIKTFNFDSTGTAQQHLASQFYASCIRLRQGFCCVQYQVWILNFPALFPPLIFELSFKHRSVQMTDHFHLTIMVQWILCLPWLVWVFQSF